MSAPQASGVMVETRKLTKSFGKLVALNGLDLVVREGEVHGLIGPNGAGKSTAIKLLAGTLRPDAGEAYIDGHHVGSVAARRATGYAPERPSFYGDMAAWDYLMHMARLSGMRGRDAAGRAAWLLDWLDLYDFRFTHVGGFSAGMKQRLGLAQALMHQPRLLILDEPTANLDPGGRMSLLEKLKGLPAGEKVTIIISSHILSELEYLVDTVSFLDKGRLVAGDRVEDMKRRAGLNRYLLNTSDNEGLLPLLRGKRGIDDVRLGADGLVHLSGADSGTVYAGVTEALAAAGVVLKQFGEEQVRLEDIYRSTIGGGTGG